MDALTYRDAVLVDDPEAAELLVAWVVIASEGECVEGLFGQVSSHSYILQHLTHLEPSVVGVTTSLGRSVLELKLAHGCGRCRRC